LILDHPLNINEEKRYELKFPLENINEVNLFFSKLKGLTPHHKPRKVISCYYDTFNNDDYWQNMEGYSERNKYRIRWYNQESGDCEGRLEQKSKISGLGLKESIYIPNVLEYMDRLRRKQFISNLSEVDFRAKFLSRSEKVRVQYNRKYYYIDTGGSEALRVTVDTNIIAKNIENRAGLFKPYFYGPMTLVEIKFNQELEYKVLKLTKALPKANMRFSKYAAAMSFFLGENY
jgi:SPX domain protein involved in polyphosphate accumulation